MKQLYAITKNGTEIIAVFTDKKLAIKEKRNLNRIFKQKYYLYIYERTGETIE